MQLLRENIDYLEILKRQEMENWIICVPFLGCVYYYRSIVILWNPQK